MRQKETLPDLSQSTRMTLDFHASTTANDDGIQSCPNCNTADMLLEVLSAASSMPFMSSSASAAASSPYQPLPLPCLGGGVTAEIGIPTPWSFADEWYYRNVTYFWLFSFSILTIYGWFFESFYQNITGFSPVVMQYLRRRPWSRVFYQAIWSLILSLGWPFALCYPFFFRVFECFLSSHATSEYFTHTFCPSPVVHRPSSCCNFPNRHCEDDDHQDLDVEVIEYVICPSPTSLHPPCSHTKDDSAPESESESESENEADPADCPSELEKCD